VRVELEVAVVVVIVAGANEQVTPTGNTEEQLSDIKLENVPWAVDWAVIVYRSVLPAWTL
jgi:hypothetical protein